MITFLPPAIDALTKGFIDFAGLFPPAKLPLAEALAAFDAARSHPYGSFLARFVLPAARASEASDLLIAPFAHARGLQPKARPSWRFSLLLKGAETAEAFFAGLAPELEAAAGLVRRSGGVATVDSIECLVPADALASPALTEGFARVVLEALGKVFPGAHTAFEIPWDVPMGGALAALAKVEGARAKFRTGGLGPSNVPSVDAVCDALVVCKSLRLPCKFTAGLHEPVRHFDGSVGAPLHGFLNLFLAAAFLSQKGWDRGKALSLVASETESDFTLVKASDANSLDAESIAFRGEILTTRELLRTRETVALSFGSCSFLEPVEGLVRMGFLPPPTGMEL
ncbi:MAG: glycosyltransferase [Silvanigrellales bacterium]|nr:glycosyltransferase [Silvanigrellales bacterium]